MTELRITLAPRVETKVMSTEMSTAVVILPQLYEHIHVSCLGNRAKETTKMFDKNYRLTFCTESDEKRLSYVFEW